MEALAPSPRAVQLLDYGIDTGAEAMFLVMKDYRCSLRQDRQLGNLPTACLLQLPLNGPVRLLAPWPASIVWDFGGACLHVSVWVCDGQPAVTT